MRLPSLEECVERLSVGIAAPTQVLQQNKDDFILALHEEIASHLIGATNGNPTACLKTAAA